MSGCAACELIGQISFLIAIHHTKYSALFDSKALQYFQEHRKEYRSLFVPQKA